MQADCIVENKSALLYVDSKEFEFTINTQLQEWINQTQITRAIDAGLKKIAILASPEIFSAVSVEQIMDEDVAANISTQYFDSETSAIEWLIK